MNIVDKKLKICLAKPNETIRKHTDNVTKNAKTLNELNYINKNTFELLNLASEYHDYGKMNVEFQKRILSKKHFDEKKEIGHNILSTFFLKEKKFRNFEDYKKVFYAVLNHHYYTKNLSELENKEELALDLLKEFDVEELDLTITKQLKGKLDISYDILIGLLNKCDYAASGNYSVEYKNDFLLDSLKNLNYNWNELQEYMLQNQENNVIVVANTGMGKTEAGLLWIGDNKGFFILPLKTAINSIYKRIKENIIEENIEKKVILMHSEAFDFFLSEFGDEKTYDEIKQYFQEGKLLSIPLTVSTLDQIFNFIFMYLGSELKLATLSYSKVVIDEIQAYSPDLLAYIVIGLKKIKESGGKFAILTATFPPFIKDYLEKDLGKIQYKAFIEGKNRHNVKILDQEIESSLIYNYYLKNPKKFLVVCNTVRRAQEIFDELQYLGVLSTEIELLHSKYIKKDRLQKERDILEFGKTNYLGCKIWISTSLVEASLDIDFDIIFTELNDLSGLFQRLGRVNRKGVKDISKYNAYVFTKINKNLFINGEKGFIDKTIFNLSKEALDEVNGILSEKKKYDLIEEYLTSEKIKLSSFTTQFKSIKSYMEKISKGRFTKEDVNKMFRNIISYKVIPKNVYIENEEKIKFLLEKYENGNTEEKELAKIELNSFVLSVGIYEKGKPKEYIQLGKEKIPLIEGEYSYEKGFEKLKEKKEEENSFDNFI